MFPLLIRIGILAGIAEVDMPTGISGIIGMGKADRETAKSIAQLPAPFADELIKGRMQYRRVDGFLERPAAIAGKPHDGLRPRAWIIRGEGNVAPHDGTGFPGQFAGKSVVDPDEAVFDELLDLRSTQCRRVNS
jgi:hypothetical protein